MRCHIQSGTHRNLQTWPEVSLNFLTRLAKPVTRHPSPVTRHPSPVKNNIYWPYRLLKMVLLLLFLNLINVCYAPYTDTHNKNLQNRFILETAVRRA